MNILIYLIDKKNNNLETDLFINYVSRFNKLSDLLKIPNIKVIYLDNKKCKSAKDETIMLKRRIISNSYKIFLDNLGQKLNSVEFSKKIFQKQEDGLENISFLISPCKWLPDRGNSRILVFPWVCDDFGASGVWSFGGLGVSTST